MKKKLILALAVLLALAVVAVPVIFLNRPQKVTTGGHVPSPSEPESSIVQTPPDSSKGPQVSPSTPSNTPTDTPDRPTGPVVSPSVEPTPTPPSSEEPTPTPTPTPEPTPTPTPTPEPTPTPTPEPTPTPTPEPTPTPTPTPTPDDPPVRVITASGHATSDTGTQLNLWVDWSIETLEDGSYKVKAIVYLDSYSLFCRERTGQNKLTIGDTPFVYSTPALSYNRNTGKHHTKFTEAEVIYTAETLPEQLTISASWFYNGTYSKIPISTIIASTVIDTTVL